MKKPVKREALCVKPVWTKESATKLLRVALDDEAASFRDGQWETIDAIIHNRKKMLLVERTGWGKSIVYFISAKIFRDRGQGPTVIISPLLALMRNQIAAAERIGIRAVTINSTNQDEWKSVKGQLLDNQVDVLLISPERLSNDDFIKDILIPVGQRLGLLVIDEAHCISDWGHDVDLALRRIADRVRMGGHDVPAESVRRRFERGLHNLFHVYRPLLDSLIMFDNSTDEPRIIAHEKNGILTVRNDSTFRTILALAEVK